jgi:hypothetical protein
MKKIFPFVLFLLTYGTMFSQTAVVEKHLTVSKNNTPINKTGGIDTLNKDTVFAKSGNVYLYKNSGGGYVFGTSKINGQSGFSQIAQKQLNTENLDMVSEVLIWFGFKKNGTGLSSVDVSIKTILPNSATGGELPNGTPVEGPGGVIGNTFQLAFSAVDTSSLGLLFTTVPITNAANIVGDFYVLLDFTNCYANSDSIGIWADKNGDGFLGAYSKYGNTWYQTNTAYQNSLNVNVAVFAVVEQSSSLQEQGFFNGIKMNVWPNPSANNIEIEYQTEIYSEIITIEIIDQYGKIVKTVNCNNTENSTICKQNLEISDLKPGGYYLSMYGKNTSGRITKKIIKQ